MRDSPVRGRNGPPSDMVNEIGVSPTRDEEPYYSSNNMSSFREDSHLIHDTMGNFDIPRLKLNRAAFDGEFYIYLWDMLRNGNYNPLMTMIIESPDLKMFIGTKYRLLSEIRVHPIFALVSSPLNLEKFIYSRLPRGYNMSIGTAVQLALLLITDPDPILGSSLPKLPTATKKEDIIRFLETRGFDGNLDEPCILYSYITGRKIKKKGSYSSGYDRSLNQYHPLGITIASFVIYNEYLQRLVLDRNGDFSDINIYSTVEVLLSVERDVFEGEYPGLYDAVQICVRIEKFEDIPFIMNRLGMIPCFDRNENIFYWFMNHIVSYGPLISRPENVGSLPSIEELLDPRTDINDSTTGRYSDVEMVSKYGSAYDLTNASRSARLYQMVRNLMNESDKWRFQFRECQNIGRTYEDSTMSEMIEDIMDNQDIIISYGNYKNYSCYTGRYLIDASSNGSELFISEGWDGVTIDENGRPVVRTKSMSNDRIKSLRVLLDAIPEDRVPYTYNQLIQKLKSYGTRYGNYKAQNMEDETRRLIASKVIRSPDLGPIEELKMNLDKIIMGFDQLKTTVASLKKLNLDWKNIPGWENVIYNLFSWFMVAGIFLKKWEGPGHEFPSKFITEGVDQRLVGLFRQHGMDYMKVGYREAAKKLLENGRLENLELSYRERRYLNEFLESGSCSEEIRDINITRELTVMVALMMPKFLIYGEEDEPPLDDSYRGSRKFAFPEKEEYGENRNKIRRNIAWVLGLRNVNFDEPQTRSRIMQLSKLLNKLYLIHIRVGGDRINFLEPKMSTSNPKRKLEYYMRISIGGIQCMAESSRLIGLTSIYLYYAIPEWRSRFGEDPTQTQKSQYDNLLKEMSQGITKTIERVYRDTGDQNMPEDYRAVAGNPPDEMFDFHKWTATGGTYRIADEYGYPPDELENTVDMDENVRNRQIMSIAEAKVNYINTISDCALYWIRPPRE